MRVGVPAAWGQDAVNQLERSLELPLDGSGPAAVADLGAGYLGMSVDLAAPDGDAVFVVSVAEGGPAQRGGLRADDVIVSVNEVPIRKLEDMDHAVHKPAGTKLVFQAPPWGGHATRGSCARRASCRGRGHGDPTAGTRSGSWGGPGDTRKHRPNLGISVADISDLARRRFAVTVNNGAVISQIREGSPASLAGLRWEVSLFRQRQTRRICQ